MGSFLRVALARLRGFLRPESGLADFDEEMASHLEMATEEKIRQGLSPAEARRQARVELGNLTQLRDAGRDVRGLPWIGSSWLDVKLGLRMLRRTWGLTLVAGLAMTVVIGIAVVVFDVLATFTSTDLPLEEGERVVALQAWDRQAGVGLGTAPRDFEHWCDSLRSVENLGAFRTVERNLELAETVAEDRPAEAVTVAEVSASGFALARVPALQGRPLLAEDALASAEPVLVIGAEVWQSRFAGDPAIVGRRVRLDGTVHTIVGVMPEGFGFPIFHRYWTPLRANPTGGLGSGSGASDLTVFARLEPGVSREAAERELRRAGRLPGEETLESGVGAPAPELRVVPYAAAFQGDVGGWVINLALVFIALLLVPPCINIAILVYARTVARQGELAARYVLGASRFNIVSQLFIEILVLALGAGAVALGVARLVVWQLVDDVRGRGDAIPFWMDFALQPRTVLFVGGLAVFAAMIAGTIPALQVTGRHLQAGLKTLGGQSAVRLGGAWTGLIVFQVACSFALLPSSVEMTWGTVRAGLLGPGFAAEEYLTARLQASPETATATEDAARFEDRRRELARLLTAEPDIAAVTMAAWVPGEGPWARVEVEAAASPEASTGEVSTGEASNSGETEVLGVGIGSDRLARVNRVDPSFFDVFELPLLTGRGFAPGDFAAGRNPVLVNRSFVEAVLGGHDPLGRRIRYRTLDGEAEPLETRPDRWFEIVGVVSDLQRHSSVQTVYHPEVPGESTAASLALRVRSDPTAAAGTLRQLTWGLDPALRLTAIRRLDAIYRQKAVGDYLGASGLVAATLSVLLLSAAGIYALMLFTVNRRRKEIGIRLALGAQPVRLLTGVLGRALSKVGLGALVGIGLALLIGRTLPMQALGGWDVPWVTPAATLFIFAVAFLALLGPARRGLKVQPIEELREG